MEEIRNLKVFKSKIRKSIEKMITLEEQGRIFLLIAPVQQEEGPAAVLMLRVVQLEPAAVLS